MPMDSLEQIIFTWEKLKDYIYFLRLTNVHIRLKLVNLPPIHKKMILPMTK